MGKYRSGSGGPTVGGCLRLDIDKLMRWGVIQPGDHLSGEMTFNFDDDKLTIKFESRLDELQESWLRLQYAIDDDWTGQTHEIDDRIFLVSTRPPFGGLRWWFLCPRLNHRVRKLYQTLADGIFGQGRHMGSCTHHSVRLCMTERCGALRSCGTGWAAIPPTVIIPQSRNGCAGRRIIG